MKALTRDEIVALFEKQRTDDVGEALEAVWRAGYQAGLAVPAREARALRDHDIAMQRRRKVAAELSVRWAHVLEGVAARHGLTVDAMLAPPPKGPYPEAVAVAESAWLLRRVTPRVTWQQLEDVLRRHHASVLMAARRVEARIAERPGLREELLALLGPAAEAKRGVA